MNPHVQPRRSPRGLGWVVWGGIVLVVGLIAVSFWKERSHSRRPVLPVLGTVAAFQLTNQFEQRMGLEDFSNQVWLANVVFTRCPGPCTALTQRMREVQRSLGTNSPVRLVSLTADPLFDVPGVLRAYADRFDADQTRWHFLTGPKLEVYRLAIDALKFAVVEKETPLQTTLDDLFIHSTMIALIDRLGRIRRYVEGDATNAVALLRESCDQLLREKL
jgi:protein SCO1